MATQVGPDRFRLPELNDFANIPADMATMVESLRPNLIGHAASIAERTAKYGTPKSSASPNSIQAPEGTMVVSKEMSAIWIKTSSTSDEWYALMKRGSTVRQLFEQLASPDQRITLGTMTIPETGLYNLSGFFTGRNNDEGKGTLREPQMLLNGELIYASVTPPVWYWTFSASIVKPCEKGDRFITTFQQRGAPGFKMSVEMAYQRIA